jgi:hypothetical protein
MEIAWWSTEDDRRETLSIPARRIQVVAAPAGTAPAAPVPAAAPVTTESPPAETQPRLTAPAGSAHPDRFAWLSLFLGVGWLASLLAWWRSSRRTARPDVEASPTAPTLSARAALRRVRQAYQNRDATAASQALLEWGRTRWPDDPPTNLGEMARRGGPDLACSIEALSRARYAREGLENWHQEPVWQALAHCSADDQRTHRAANADPLAELNP